MSLPSASRRRPAHTAARHDVPAAPIVRAGDMAAAGHASHLSENGVWLTDTVPAAHIDVGDAALPSDRCASATMIRKAAPLCLLILGTIAMAWAFFGGAGNALPYPDPTPQLLADQAAKAEQYRLIFILGILSTATGALWLRRRSRTKTRDRDSIR
jgi:hypothetical protein